MSEKRQLYGLELDAMTMDEVLSHCDQALKERQRVLVGVVNAAKIVKVRRDARLRDSLIECDLLLADGQAVVWASRLLGQSLPERVAGIDLFERLLERASYHKRSVYLLGARADVLVMLEQRVISRFPGLTIVGSHDGYFTTEESASVAADIARSNADMLFLGMTSPKKEIFLGTYGEILGVPILHGVGGSFDILAGITRRAPVRWQRMGLEWLYRLLQEPRRMWRRYLTTNTEFIWLTIRERIHPSQTHHQRTTGSDKSTSRADRI